MRSRGFTLIEFAVVLVVFGIVVARGLPMLGDYVQNASLRRAATDIHQGASIARIEAIKRNARTELRVTTGGWSVFNVTAVPAVQLSGGTFSGSVSATPAVVGFASNGRTFPAGTQSTMNLSSAAGGCGSTLRCPSVRVAAGGSAAICDPSKSAGTYGACS